MTPVKFTEGMVRLHDEALEALAKAVEAEGGSTKYFVQAQQEILRRLTKGQMTLMIEALLASGYHEGLERMEETFNVRIT